MTVRIGCPSCGGEYEIRPAGEGPASRVRCPVCRIEFVMYPDEPECTPDGHLIAPPMEVPLDDEPSDAEVLSATAVGEYTIARARTDPSATSRVRQVEEMLGATVLVSDRRRSLDPPSLDPDADLIRLRNNQGADAATLARRLLDEERMVPQERFVPAGEPAPVRWMMVGALCMALIVACGGVGAAAGWSSMQGQFAGTPQLEGVIALPKLVSAPEAPAEPIPEEETVRGPPPPPAPKTLEEPVVTDSMSDILPYPGAAEAAPIEPEAVVPAAPTEPEPAP